jgi:hypothetical protein
MRREIAAGGAVDGDGLDGHEVLLSMDQSVVFRVGANPEPDDQLTSASRQRAVIQGIRADQRSLVSSLNWREG